MRAYFSTFVFLAILCSCLYGFGQTTFNYTGGMQTYTVPAGVTNLTAIIRGAQGGNGVVNSGGSGIGTGGFGAMIQATITVTPGQLLYLFVGGKGTSGLGTSAGGYNGGGTHSGGTYNTEYWGGGGGGGASDIRVNGTAAANRIIIAGGGGGGGGGRFAGYNGGKGGNQNSQSGDGSPVSLGGLGGSQTNGGTGGISSVNSSGNGGPGSLLIGGFGFAGGGGGGGGFYGGGGAGSVTSGGYGEYGGGGGGGSSFYNTSVVSNPTLTQGGNSGNGSITVSVVQNPPSSNTQNATAIGINSSMLNGIVNDNGSSTSTAFEYSISPTLATGVTSVSGNPAIIATGTGNTSVTVLLSGLTSNVTYYYRIKATNAGGSSFGNILNFTTVNVAGPFSTTANGAWNDPNSWQFNIIPTANTNVIVKNAITVSSNAVCWSLLVQNPGSITVLPGVTLQVIH